MMHYCELNNYEGGYVRLKIYMKEMGYSQADVCRMTGISRDLLSKVLMNKRSMTSSFVAKLKKANFPVRWICYGF